MLIVPGGPLQAQYWINEEKKRRRFERLKQSRASNGIKVRRKESEKEAFEDLKKSKKVFFFDKKKTGRFKKPSSINCLPKKLTKFLIITSSSRVF